MGEDGALSPHAFSASGSMYGAAVFRAAIAPRGLSDGAVKSDFYVCILFLMGTVLHDYGCILLGAVCGDLAASGDRRRVMTSMNVAINVCSAFPYLLVPFLMDYAASPGSRLSMSNVFFLFGMIGGVVGIGLFSLAGFFVKERVEQSSNRPGLRESAAELLHNSALRSIVLSGLILSLSGIGYAFMNYYFIDVLGSASLSVLSQIPAAITWLFSYALLPVIKKKVQQPAVHALVPVRLRGDLVVYLFDWHQILYSPDCGCARDHGWPIPLWPD